MSKTYIASVEVRGYELDGYGHVNHAVYVNYLEFARWKLLEEEGISLRNFEEWKRWPVIAALELQYLKPAFIGETLTIETTLVEAGRTSFSFAQTILREGQPITRAKIKAVMVNEQGRPAPMPDALRALDPTSKGEPTNKPESES